MKSLPTVFGHVLRWRLLGPAVLVAVLSFGLAACTSDAPAKPVRLGLNIWPGYEYIYVAQQQGFFADEGLDVHLVEFSSTSDVHRAFERGKLDGMASTVVEVIQSAVNSGRVGKIFMVMDFSNGADKIVAQPDIGTLAELRGKRMGMEVSSLGQFVVARALAIQGIALDEIEVVPLTQQEMPRAMAAGAVDAVMIYSPFAEQLLSAGNYQVLFTSAEIPREVVDVMSLSPELVENYPQVPVKILRAWQRALEFAEEQPEEAHRIAASREGVSPEQFARSLESLHLLSLDEQRTLLTERTELELVLQRVIDLLVAEDQKAALPEPQAFIYADALRETAGTPRRAPGGQ